MRNERGITLVELLAALALVGIVVALTMAIFWNGTSSAERTTSKQRLQQEANLIVESVRAEYLKNSTEPIKLSIKKTENKLKMNARTLSEGYEYVFEKEGGEVLDISIKPTENVKFVLKVTDGKHKYKIDTTLSKLR